jgi:hypothetical protein
VAVGGIHVFGEFDAAIRVRVVGGGRNKRYGGVGLARAVLVVAGLDLVDSCLSGGRWRILRAVGSGGGLVGGLQEQESVSGVVLVGVLDTDRIGLVLLCGSCPEGVVRGGGAGSLLHGHLGRSVDLAQCLHTVVSASQARHCCEELTKVSSML